MAKTYNGHKNWNHWNVSLWIANDEPLYRMCREEIRRCRNRDVAARSILEILTQRGVTKTPDGAPYTYTTIRAAICGL